MQKNGARVGKAKGEREQSEISHRSLEAEGLLKGILEELLGMRYGVLTWESVMCFSGCFFF